MLSLFGATCAFDVVPPARPFQVRPLLEAMEGFLTPVQPGQRVLMAFDDPGDSYDRIFDGYRTLIELPLHVAVRKGVLFLPNWWSVFQTNYRGAPEFWGRTPEQVARRAGEWNAAYVVVYQERGATPDAGLDATWERAGFRVAREFHWGDHTARFDDWTLPNLSWWLLEPPAAERLPPAAKGRVVS